MHLARPKLIFLAGLLGVHLVLAFVPEVMAKFGVGRYGPWFRDAYAMLAASDSAQAGYDPFVENPYDLIGERHIYSDWWFALGKMGLDRSDHSYLGLTFLLAFWAAVTWVLPLATKRDAWLALAVCGSPPFWLAANRGNPDLLMFALLTLAAGMVLRPGVWPGRLALVPLGLAVGLKYYPVLGAGLLLAWPTRPASERVWRIVVGGVGLALVGWLLRDALANYFSVGWLARGQLTFGAAALPMKAGLDGESCVRLGLVAGAGLALWAAWRTRDERVTVDPTDRTALLFLLGATLLGGNFFLTVDFLYKGIFAVWLLPAFLIWAAGTGPLRGLARGWLALVIVILWFVPLVCLASPWWLEWLGAASEAPVRRSAAALVDALAWVVVVPVLWLAVPMLRALVRPVRKEAA
ncbi:MAG: hypothetical protein ACO3DQ_04490 [Cephaloticoccus sp.]